MSWEDPQGTAAAALRDFTGANLNKNATTFIARVLTTPIPFDEEDAKLIISEGWIPPPLKLSGSSLVPADEEIPPGSLRGDSKPRIMFRGRIIRSHNNLRPHILIRDPCRISASRDMNFVYRLLQKHTLYISTHSWSGKTPKIGDLVEITPGRADFVAPDLQASYFNKVVDMKSSDVYNWQNRIGCESLIAKMETAGFVTGVRASGGSGGSGAAGGSSGHPSSNYQTADSARKRLGRSGPTLSESDLTGPAINGTKSASAQDIHKAYPACPLKLAIKIVATANALSKDLDPGWLANVIHYESAATWWAGETNSFGYTGLIQFGDGAAEMLNTTTAQLRGMSELQQMNYVYRYLRHPQKRLGANYDNSTDLYMAIFWPNAVGNHNIHFPANVVGANNNIDEPREYARRANAGAHLPTGPEHSPSGFCRVNCP